MKRVLVTGASGFIGFQALPCLLQRGYEVIAVGNSTTVPQAATGMGNVNWIQADLLDSDVVSNLMAKIKPTHLLHFAWYTVPGHYWSAQENFEWVRASLHLLMKFAVNGGTRVVSAGTCAEYDWSQGRCVEHQTPLAPGTTYGVCKGALAAMQSAFCDQLDIGSAWGRIFLLYGPREHPNRLVSSVVNSLLKGIPARCTHGNQLRDVLYVEEVADAFVALLDSDVVGPVNVASGNPVALREVIYTIADLLDRRDLIELGAMRASPNEPEMLVADTRRLLNEVGWQPATTLTDGLARTIEWWQAN